MSYDVYGNVAGCSHCGSEGGHVFSWNFTSNSGPQWRLAGADLAEFHGMKAAECAPIVRAAIDNMERDPAAYIALDSPNGWGTYKHLLPAMKVLLREMINHPTATIEISR